MNINRYVVGRLKSKENEKHLIKRVNELTTRSFIHLNDQRRFSLAEFYGQYIAQFELVMLFENKLNHVESIEDDATWVHIQKMVRNEIDRVFNNLSSIG